MGHMSREEALLQRFSDDETLARQLKESGLVSSYETTEFGFNGRSYVRCSLVLTPDGEAERKRIERNRA